MPATFAGIPALTKTKDTCKMEPMTILMLIIGGFILLGLMLIKALWRSPLFWVAATLLTILALPLTAGMSPLVLTALIILRVVLITRVFKASEEHRA